MSLSRTVVPNEVGLPRDRDGHGAGCGGVDFTKYPTSHWKNNNTTQSLSLCQASGSSYNDGEYSMKIFWPHEPCRPGPALTPQAPAQKKPKEKAKRILSSTPCTAYTERKNKYQKTNHQDEQQQHPILEPLPLPRTIQHLPLLPLRTPPPHHPPAPLPHPQQKPTLPLHLVPTL